MEERSFYNSDLIDPSVPINRQDTLEDIMDIIKKDNGQPLAPVLIPEETVDLTSIVDYLKRHSDEETDDSGSTAQGSSDTISPVNSNSPNQLDMEWSSLGVYDPSFLDSQTDLFSTNGPISHDHSYVERYIDTPPPSMVVHYYPSTCTTGNGRSSAASSPDAGDSYELKRMKNNSAVRRSRMKAKKELEEKERNIVVYSRENVELTDRIKLLEKELTKTKNFNHRLDAEFKQLCQRR